MTDPVDTDALRARRSAWQEYAAETPNLDSSGPRRVEQHIGFDAGWDAAADEVDRLRDRAVDDARNRERLRVDFNARAAEASRLRSVIESAPHGRACRWLYATSQSCTCWKADAL